MWKWNYWLLLLLVVSSLTAPEAEARRRGRRGVGAANFININRLGRFGLFNRAFFPFFGFGRNFGFNQPVIIPFDANVINPFNPFQSFGNFPVDILGSGHDFGPRSFIPQPQNTVPSNPQPQVAPPIDTSSQRAIADTSPSPPQSFSDYFPSDLQRILANAVRSVPEAQSVAGEWSDELCRESEPYAQRMARQGFQDGHQGFKSGRDQIALKLGTSAEEITAEGSGSPEQAAQDCVNGWFLSSRHKAALLNFHQKFCYSMARSANGRYYCVGLFSN
jgi:uncharacterized protein YkwD